MKRSFLLVFFLLVLSVLAASETLYYQEGDTISLRPLARDQDGDKLQYYFSPPLSGRGDWQTSYGDAGTYLTQVAVTDGRVKTVRNVTLVIAKKEETPSIDTFSPPEEKVLMLEGQTALFTLKASDLNKDPLTITWLLDGEEVGRGSYFLYEPDYYSAGIHLLEARVSDTFTYSLQSWDVDVGKVDRAALLDGFRSLTINETQILSFTLPDFKAYGLSYTLSDPVGEDGVWETTYDDAGLYSVDITISDGIAFNETRTIKVLVEDVDRPPLPLSGSAFHTQEAATLEIPLDYTDPDGDKVAVDVEGLPPGARFRKGVLTWTPGYDTVTKETPLDEVARRYQVLNREFRVNITASSRQLSTSQQISIRVFNTNRHPVILSASDIRVMEGERISVTFEAADPDGDALTYTLEGFPPSNNYQTKEGDAGEHLVKLIVSDGFLFAEKTLRVSVLPAPRKLVLDPVSPALVAEGAELGLMLSASGPEGEDIAYTVDPLPEGAKLVGAYFTWTPPFTLVTHDTPFNLTFTASGGRESAVGQSAIITVLNTPTSPEIIASSQVDGKSFGVGESIPFFVRAQDQDGDELNYRWMAGGNFLEDTGDEVLLSFQKEGRQKVSVRVSDGSKTVTRDWDVDIVKRPRIVLYQGEASAAPQQQVQRQIVQAQAQSLQPSDPRFVTFSVQHQGDQPSEPTTIEFEIG